MKVNPRGCKRTVASDRSLSDLPIATTQAKSLERGNRQGTVMPCRATAESFSPGNCDGACSYVTIPTFRGPLTGARSNTLRDHNMGAPVNQLHFEVLGHRPPLLLHLRA